MVASPDWATVRGRDCKWLETLKLWFPGLSLARDQEQAKLTLGFGGVAPDEALLPGQRARLAQARPASCLGALGMPGGPLFLGQSAALAPDSGGGAEHRARAQLRESAGVAIRDITAPALSALEHVIDVGTGFATHGSAVLEQPGMLRQLLGRKGRLAALEDPSALAAPLGVPDCCHACGQ